MNTKQFLILGLSFALTAHVAAMEETPAQQARRLREEATQRRIAQLQAEQDAKKKPTAIRPVVKAPVAPKPTDINNNNNAVAPKKAPQPIVAVPAKPTITKPVVKAEVPKEKEEDTNEPSAEELLKDRARAQEIKRQSLARTHESIAAYAQEVLDKNDEALAAEITNSSAKNRIAEQRAHLEAGLQLIEDRYAHDVEFTAVQRILNAMMTVLNLQEQLLDRNALDQDIVADQFDVLIIENNDHVGFSQALNKMKAAYILASITLQLKPTIDNEQDANASLIAQLADEDAQETARELQMQEEMLKNQAEQEAIARGIADAQLARQIQMELDGNNAAGPIDENEFVAAQLAREEREAQEQAGMLAALELNEQNQPVVDNDALIAQEMAAQLAAEQEAASLALIQAMEEDNQPAVDNDAFLAEQFAQQLRDEESAAQEEASLALIRRLQNEQ